MDPKKSKKRTKRAEEEPTEKPNKRQKREESPESEDEIEEEAVIVQPQLPKTQEEKQSQARLYVILEQANLETVLSKRGTIEIINSDEHREHIKKGGKAFEEYRPDVAHQSLLALLDSPLNKAGLLQVFVRTAKNVLIELNP